MLNAVLVFLGCGIGGLLRYWTTTVVYLGLGRGFPHGTLVVNVSGSFVMGLLTIFIQSKFSTLEMPLRALFLVGLLGGYTTFSSFSMDTLGLIESGRYLLAALYIILSFVLCLAGVWFGVVVGRQI